MNILFLTTRIIYGGGEKVMNWLAKELSRQGHSLFYANPGIIDSYNQDAEKIGISQFVTIVEYNHAIKKKKPFTFIKTFRNIFQSNQINVLIIFGGSLVEQLIARSLGVKVVLAERCNPSFRPFLSRILKPIQFLYADGYVFQTEEQGLYYGKSIREKGTVILNPIIDELPDPIFNNTKKEIVTVGRLSKEKNQKAIIRVFGRIADRYPAYKLVIYGDGPLKEELNQLAVNLGVADKIVIVSGVNDIINHINGADVFILNSFNEGMPNTLIEAMSVGLVCISSDCPIYGPRCLIQNGVNGYLIPVDDEEKLETALVNVVSNMEDMDRIRKNAVGIRERLNAQIIFDQWNNYLTETVGNKQ